MRAGKLDSTISIQRGTMVRDEGGGTEWTFVEVAKARAHVIQTSTEEFMRTWGQATDTITVFRTRWLDDIKTTDRIMFNGVPLNIVEMKPIARRRGLEIRCKVGNPNGQRA